MAKAYSYARYSTQQQSAEAGGESLARQLSLARAWCARQTPPVTLDEELVDEATSGSKGKHITDGKPLGRFLKRVETGQKHPDPRLPAKGDFLVIESFSRLSRLPIDLGNGIFSDLIRADIRLVVMQQQGRIYDRASLRRNPGELSSVITLLEAAHAEAAGRAQLGKWSWNEGGRRLRLTYMTPAWIRPSKNRIEMDGVLRFPDGTEFELIAERVEVIVTIFRLYISGYGVDRIVRMLNDRKGTHYRPAFPRATKPGTKPSRAESPDRGWHHSYIRSLLFTRRVLGEIDACETEYDDEGKARSIPTGVRYKLYEPAISETMWQEAQDAKRHGVAGPKGEGFTNLFGGIAKCGGCGASMRLVNKGADNSYRYLTCSNAKRGKDCGNRKLHRYEPFEHGMLKMLGVLAFGDMPDKEDGTAHIRKQIAKTIGEVTELQIQYDRKLELEAKAGGTSHDLWIRHAAKLKADHTAKLTRQKSLEAEYTKMRNARPLSEQLGDVNRLVDEMDKLPADDRYAVRSKINAGLSGILKSIQFNQDGEIRLKFLRMQRELPYSPDAPWHFIGVTKGAALVGRKVDGKLQMQGFNAPVTDKQYQAQLAIMKARNPDLGRLRLLRVHLPPRLDALAADATAA